MIVPIFLFWLIAGIPLESSSLERLPTKRMISAADEIIIQSEKISSNQVRKKDRARFYSLIPRLGGDFVAVSFIGPQINKERLRGRSELPETFPPGQYAVAPSKLPNRLSSTQGGCYYYVAIVNVRAKTIYSETCS